MVRRISSPHLPLSLAGGGSSSSSIMPSERAVCCRRCCFAHISSQLGVKSSLDDDDDDDFALTLLGEKKKKNLWSLSPFLMDSFPSLSPPYFFKSIHCVFDCLSSGFNWFHSCHADLLKRRSSSDAEMQGRGGGGWRGKIP